MGRRERHQLNPLERYVWTTRQRMKSGELDPDLARLLLGMAAAMKRWTPKAPEMLQGLQVRFWDLYERLESGATVDLMTHVRACNQLDALYRSIQGSVRRDKFERGRPTSVFTPSQPRRKGPLAAAPAVFVPRYEEGVLPHAPAGPGGRPGADLDEEE